MLFTNVNLKVREVEFKFGEVEGVSIGERGRGRREVFLPTPSGLETIDEGLHPELTIGTSKSGRPRINRGGKEDEIYMILSTGCRYTRRGNGVVRVPESQKVQIIARGNGADGDAGRIGTWTAVVLKAKDGDVFRVTWGGSGYGIPCTYYVVHDRKVYAVDEPHVATLFDTLDIEMPFSLTFEDGVEIDYDKWETI